MVAEASRARPEPLGIDGCGVPTLRGNVVTLATAFGALSEEARFRPVVSAVSRFPGLVGDNLRPDGRLGSWWGGLAKGGAAGLMAVGRNGVGAVAKSHDGQADIAVAVLIVALHKIGLVTDAMYEGLRRVAELPVLGGGKRVGQLEVMLS
jgi:L-asparaginase II